MVCISLLHMSSCLLDREAFIFSQKVISLLPFTMTLTFLPKVQYRVKPQAQIHFLENVALTQLLHTFQFNFKKYYMIPLYNKEGNMLF